MEAAVITTVDTFVAERERWEALYRADPQAQMFLSWAWLAAYLPGVRDAWEIHVLRDEDAFVAALPLLIRPLPHRRLPFARELAFAGDPLADYRGMLCRTGRTDEATAAFAAAILALEWDRADFDDVRDERFAPLVAQVVRGGRAELRQGESAACPSLELPADYPAFLAGLSKPTRRATQRLPRFIAQQPQMATSRPGPADAEAHVRAVVGLNADRFGSSALRRGRLTSLLRAAHATGCLRMRVVWDGRRPVAGAAAFVDPLGLTFGLYLIGHHRDYDRHSPGKGLIGMMVSDAIDEGYRQFDFLRGDAAFKTSYADRVTRNQSFRLRRPSLRNTLLDAITPVYAAARAAALLALRARPRSA